MKLKPMTLKSIFYRFSALLLILLAPGLASAIEGNVGGIVDGSSGTASDLSGVAYSVFDSNPNDISLSLLRKLFGSVGDVLVANQEQLLGKLLGIFNIGMWVIAGLLVSFVVITTVLHTAKEGELVGQRPHMLTLYKAVMGMALLTPLASGYSFIQIIVIWVVIQGVNLADNVWSTALDYLSQGGVVASNISPARYKTALPIVSDVLESEICMYLMQFHDQETQKQALARMRPLPPNPSNIDILRYNQVKALATQPTDYSPDYSPDGMQVSFGTSPNPNPVMDTHGMCGVYSWKNSVPSTQSKIGMGMTQLVTELLPAAYLIAQNAWTSAALANPNINPFHFGTPSLPDPCLSSSNPNPGENCVVVPILQAAATHYVDLVMPLSAGTNTGLSGRLATASKYGWAMAGVFYRDLIQNVNSTTVIGLSANEKILNSANPGLPPLVPDNGPPPPSPERSRLDMQVNTKIAGDNGYFAVGTTPYILPMQLAFQAVAENTAHQMNYIKATENAFDKIVAAWNAANSYGALNKTITQNNQYLLGDAASFKSSFPGMDYLLAQDVEQMIATLWNAWLHLTQPAVVASASGTGSLIFNQVPRDLIGALSAFGVELMQGVLTFWHDAAGHIWQEVTGIAAGFTIAMALISGLSGWIQELGVLLRQVYLLAFPIPVVGQIIFGILYPISVTLQVLGFTAYQLAGAMVLAFKITITVIFWYLPIFLYVGLSIFMIGVLLGVYAPLIPYLLFTFGVLGWFIGVIEAMIAGPLIALGITHPNGQHDYLGRAEQAVMLLLNILLRPAVMVIGLLAATVLSFVTFALLNIGFSEVFNYSLNQIIKNGPAVGNLGMFNVILAFMALYTTMALVLINRCFSLIYIIPDRLARWFGAQPEQSMPDSVLEHIKGGVSRSVQSVAGSQAQTNLEMTKAVSAAPAAMQQGGAGPDKGKKEK